MVHVRVKGRSDYLTRLRGLIPLRAVMHPALDVFLDKDLRETVHFLGFIAPHHVNVVVLLRPVARRMEVKAVVTAVLVGICDDRLRFGVDRTRIGVVFAVVAQSWSAMLAVVAVHDAVEVDEGNDEYARVLEGIRGELVGNALKHIRSRGFTGMVARGQDDACLALTEAEAGNRVPLAALAELFDGEIFPPCEFEEMLRMIEGMVREIDTVLVVSEAIDEGVFLLLVVPMPILEIVADGRSPEAETRVVPFFCTLKVEGQFTTRGTFNAKRKVEPIFCGIALLVSEINVIAFDAVDKNVAADEFIVDDHRLQFLLSSGLKPGSLYHADHSLSMLSSTNRRSAFAKLLPKTRSRSCETLFSSSPA